MEQKKNRGRWRKQWVKTWKQCKIEVNLQEDDWKRTGFSLQKKIMINKIMKLREHKKKKTTKMQEIAKFCAHLTF